MTFNDAEEFVQDSELTEPPDEALDRELRLQQRRNVKEIRQLENEVCRRNEQTTFLIILWLGTFSYRSKIALIL